MLEEKKCKCGNPILENLGYSELCAYCKREELMEMPDSELADELTRNVFIHKKDWMLYETLRRSLLQNVVEQKTVPECECCPFCHSSHVKKRYVRDSSNRIQSTYWHCYGCNREFYVIECKNPGNYP